MRRTAGCAEEVADVLDRAAAGLGKVAVEGGEASLQLLHVRVRSAAVRVDPAQVGPLAAAEFAWAKEILLS